MYHSYWKASIMAGTKNTQDDRRDIFEKASN